jgi:hypothetical protein
MLAKRWNEHRLPAHARPQTRFEYWVTGGMDFPLDMLRYDSAWPATGEDVAKLDFAGDRRVRSIKLFSYIMPTLDRWSSFGWSVGTADLGGGRP